MWPSAATVRRGPGPAGRGGCPGQAMGSRPLTLAAPPIQRRRAGSLGGCRPCHGARAHQPPWDAARDRAQPVPSPALLPGVLPAEGLSFLLSLSFCATALCLPVPVSPSLPLPPCPFPPQIPRYILTLHELLAHTPHEHVERNSLDYAKSKLEELSR